MPTVCTGLFASSSLHGFLQKASAQRNTDTVSDSLNLGRKVVYNAPTKFTNSIRAVNGTMHPAVVADSTPTSIARIARRHIAGETTESSPPWAPRTPPRRPTAAIATSFLPPARELSATTINSSHPASIPSIAAIAGRCARSNRAIPPNVTTTVSSHCFCSVFRE